MIIHNWQKHIPKPKKLFKKLVLVPKKLKSEGIRKYTATPINSTESVFTETITPNSTIASTMKEIIIGAHSLSGVETKPINPNNPSDPSKPPVEEPQRPTDEYDAYYDFNINLD